jgi:hypothetical protein
MPTIVEIPVVINSVDYAHETHTRSAGLHVSTVISSFERENMGIFKGEGMDAQALEEYRMLGFLFERVLYDIIFKDENIQRLGEFEHDGLILTPDAINLGRGRGVESKATFRSMKNDVLDMTGEFATWWMQMMAYAKALGINLWDLWVLFIRGDYGKNGRPQMRHWEIEFEQWEVDLNWRRIKNHAIWMEATGRG